MNSNSSWLIFGSAPEPTPPAGGAAGKVLVCINSSGYTARQLGLPQPDFTVFCFYRLFAEDKRLDLEVLRGLRTGWLLLAPAADDVTRTKIERVLAGVDYGYERITNFQHRDHVVRAATGMTFDRGDPDTTKMSNGICAACLALYEGAAEVILTGISLRRDGHSYTSRVTRRKHIAPDRLAIEAMLARGAPVKTLEPELAADTGLELV